MADDALSPRTSGSVLARTLAIEIVPGSNRRAPAAGSCLVYLLPDQAVGRIGLAGQSSPATIRMLARHGELVEPGDGSGRIDLLWLGEHPSALSPTDPVLSDLAARLVPDGLVVGEVWAFRRDLAMRQLRSRLTDTALELELALWLRPGSGPIRTILPADDEPTMRFVVERGIAAPFRRIAGTRRLPVLADLEGSLAASLIGNRLGQRIGFVARRRVAVANVPAASASVTTSESAWAAESSSSSAAASPWSGPGPPRWLQDAVRHAIPDIGERRWALSAPGSYASQKAVWYLFERDAVIPDLVIKMTRDPAFNDRLRNEVAILKAVEGLDLGPRVEVPRAIALASADGLALAVESCVIGAPFPTRVRVRSEPPALGLAVESLTRMAVATRAAASPSAIRDALEGIVDRCARLYAMAPEERAFLDAQVERLAAVGSPTVLMHGDPGTWNLLVTADSGLGILDWEAAELDGLPLWDLFHLLRAYATLTSSRWLPGRAFRLARGHLVRGSALTPTLAAAVRAYSLTAGIETDAVEPLYHLGWVHRAVKEAMRLAPDRLAHGHYIRLLRSGMVPGATPGLDLLLGRDRGA
jgi:hypothetical protein